MSEIDIKKLIKHDFVAKSDTVVSVAQFEFYENKGKKIAKAKTAIQAFKQFEANHELTKYVDAPYFTDEEQALLETRSNEIEKALNDKKLVQEENKKIREAKKKQTHIGYKVVKRENGQAVSGADSRQNFELKKYSNIEMAGDGVFLGTNKQYVMDYYSGLAEDEVLLTLQFEEKDIVKGNINDKEPELALRTAKIMNINDIKDGVVIENKNTTKEPVLNAVTSLILGEFKKIDEEGIGSVPVYNPNGHYSLARRSGAPKTDKLKEVRPYEYVGMNQGILHNYQNEFDLSTSVFCNAQELKNFGIDVKEHNIASEIFVVVPVSFYYDKEIEKQNRANGESKNSKISYKQYLEKVEEGKQNEIRVIQKQKDRVVYHHDLIPEELRTPEFTKWYQSQPEYKLYIEKQKKIAAVGIDQYTKDIADQMKKDSFDVIKKLGVDLKQHKKIGAFYRQSDDTIFTPNTQGYASPLEEARTINHETGHATGHFERLKRDLTGDKESDAYKGEEVTADTYSYLQSLKYGLNPTYITATASYQKGYARCKNGNPKSIQWLNKYCKQAKIAFDYVENLVKNDLVLNISHNAKKTIENDNVHKVAFGDQIEDIAILALIKQGIEEPTREQLNNAVGTIIQQNKVENPTELSLGNSLKIPTLEMINQYVPNEFSLEKYNDIFDKNKRIIIEPTLSSSEVSHLVVDAMVANNESNITPAAQANMRTHLSGDLGKLRGNTEQYKYIALNNPELQNVIKTIQDNAEKGVYDQSNTITETNQRKKTRALS